MSVFISRELELLSPLREGLMTDGFSVLAKSLITVSRIRFTHTPRCDWIFFSSKNAITHFFAQDPVIGPGTRFAVMGEGSAHLLQRYGRQPAFVGTGNDATAIARRFVEQVDSEIVLFPQAIDSMQTVQRWLSFNNIARNLFVYKVTPIREVVVPECDILVFTSPSNVEGFFSLNRIAPHQSVIAIGTTTKLSLKRRGVTDIHLPVSFSEESILQKIRELAQVHSG